MRCFSFKNDNIITKIILNEHIALTRLHVKCKILYETLVIFLAVLRLILTKQNKIVKQNEIIMAKITNLEKKISPQTSHCQLSNQTKDKLRETFMIKTENDLEEFDACLKRKKFFDEVVSIIHCNNK